MKFVTQANVLTENAKKYASQLGKHWSHSLAIEEDGDSFHITFPKDARGADWPDDAIVTLAPEQNGLTCKIAASSERQRDGLKGAVARHVDRFAFREAPLTYEWQDSQD